MSNYNTSREPMTMDEFIALAKCDGWTLKANDAGQPKDQVNLVDGAGRMIVAYPQPTRFNQHIGFKGSNCGLLKVWEEGTIEQQVLEGQDLDEDTTGPDVLEAYEEVLAHYASEPEDADVVRRELSEIARGQITDFTTIDDRWSLWAPSEAEKAHFCATRATVEWLCSRRDGETDPIITKAYDRLADKALEVHAEAAEPPLTQMEVDRAWDIAMDMMTDFKCRDHADEWMESWGRRGARDVIAEYEE